VKIGYARTSTIEQKAGLDAQLRDLKAAGVEKVFQEQLSSVDAKRLLLEAAIDFCREGDVLVCTKLDRLARSVADVVKIEELLNKRGASLLVMDPAMDTSSPAGRLVFNVLASIAQFEREIMLTRQREGIARAKGEGKYKGRQPTARAKSAEVLAMRRERIGATEIARKLGIGRRSVYRIFEDQAAAAGAGKTRHFGSESVAPDHGREG
jgi:DNA invertase Pin-like site-specific DNA recombinase